VLPQVRQRVRFAPLNLAEDSFPSLATDTQAMDIIFCRNVLMYFTREQAARVVEKLRRSLRADGWLVLSSTEATHALSRSAGFTPVNIAGITLYRKGERRPAAAPESAAPFEASAFLAPAMDVVGDKVDTATSLYRRGEYGEAAEAVVASLAPDAVPEAPQFSLLARACANQGQLQEALSWCDRWIAAESLDSGARYLRAMVLEETGNTDEARRSLQQAIYLQPDFVLAHFALGNLARNARQLREAHRHFDNTLALLNRLPGDAALPESDGLTAARLKEVVESLFVLENAS
jgi:chemotaxis protein methyltransferase CheR